jgi:hypothetical protein
MTPRASLLASLVALLTACQLQDDVIATRLPSLSSAGSASVGGAAGTVGGAGGGGAAGQACVGFAPTLSLAVGEQREETCAGWIARRAFSHAICSCADLDVLAVLASSPLDSSVAGPLEDDDRKGAAIGVNGNYGGGEYVRIDGSFTVSGTAAMASRGGIDVAADLRLAAPASAAGPIFIGRDAWLLEAASSKSLVTVLRDLHLGPNGSIGGAGPAIALGRTVHESFEVAPPCECANETLVDIDGVVSQGMTQNDNGRFGLALDALSDVTSPKQLTLSCGRFALRQISGEAEIALRIAGRVILVVDGDVEAGRKFSLELEPGAALDLFIGGNLTISGESLIGDNTRPAATRVYVRGAGDIALPGTARFSANLYAPHAELTVLALGDVYGAAFGAAVKSLGPLLAHYDRAVLQADADCAVAPPARCSSCDQCGAAKTCVAGVCTTCATDDDCCFPLVCAAGACQPLGTD